MFSVKLIFVAIVIISTIITGILLHSDAPAQPILQGVRVVQIMGLTFMIPSLINTYIMVCINCCYKDYKIESNHTASLRNSSKTISNNNILLFQFWLGIMAIAAKPMLFLILL